MMLTRDDAIRYSLTFPGAYEDYPFDDINWTVMRRGDNRHGFAWIFEREGRVWINLKCAPDWAEVFRKQYQSVLPAYHMNKKHWNSVILDGSIEDEVIESMIEDSFCLCGN